MSKIPPPQSNTSFVMSLVFAKSNNPPPPPHLNIAVPESIGSSENKHGYINLQ